MDWKPDREPDFAQFEKVLRREGRPDHLPVYEHIASPGFIASRTGKPFASMTPADPDYWRVYVEFWLSLGFDGIPIEVPLACALGHGDNETGKESHGSEAHAVIKDMEDFERYPWPDLSAPLEFQHYERAAEFLPAGAKLVAGVAMGPYEWVSQMMGVQGISTAIFTHPELVQAVFDKIHALHLSALRQLVKLDAVGALRQGDDLGFKTSTFLSPEHLRQYVFPVYRDMAELAHNHGKPFVLHSCGNLERVYEDLIEFCRIDAKHSFEDTILPVVDFKKKYGNRITPLGGIDVDKVCQLPEDELRAYTRRIVEVCFEDGYWAFGTGNSLTNYMPVEKYLMALDEAMTVAA